MNAIVRKHRQHGISIIALVLLLAMLASMGIVAMRIAPLYADYITVLQIAKDMQQDGSLANSSKREIRDMLNKRFRTNNLWDLKAKDTVKIEKDRARGTVLHIDYEVRSQLISNLDVIAKFDTVISAVN
jgi:hypothetical protein